MLNENKAVYMLPADKSRKGSAKVWVTSVNGARAAGEMWGPHSDDSSPVRGCVVFLCLFPCWLSRGGPSEAERSRC